MSTPFESWFNGDPLQQIEAGTYDMYREKLANKYSEEELVAFDKLNKARKAERKKYEEKLAKDAEKVEKAAKDAAKKKAK